MDTIGAGLDRLADPLLTPFRLKHLTLRNRVMSTSHEPYYSEDGMPKDRYRLYHVEKARGGMALTMTAGSAVVSPDSPPVFGNLLAGLQIALSQPSRIDDVLNVSGHRMGTMEIESALVSCTDLVAEAAVVGRPDDTTGEAICAFVAR